MQGPGTDLKASLHMEKKIVSDTHVCTDAVVSPLMVTPKTNMLLPICFCTEYFKEG